jgi:methylmalonyl-CoA mutase cobalamin-binding subunit
MEDDSDTNATKINDNSSEYMEDLGTTVLGPFGTQGHGRGNTVMRAKAGSRGAHVMPLSGHPSRMSLGAVACAKAGSRVGLPHRSY